VRKRLNAEAAGKRCEELRRRTSWVGRTKRRKTGEGGERQGQLGPPSSRREPIKGRWDGKATCVCGKADGGEKPAAKEGLGEEESHGGS